MHHAKTAKYLPGRWSARSLCLAVIVSTMTAAAQSNAPTSKEGVTIAAWDAFAGRLGSLGDELAAHLPERLRNACVCQIPRLQPIDIAILAHLLDMIDQQKK